MKKYSNFDELQRSITSKLRFHFYFSVSLRNTSAIKSNFKSKFLHKNKLYILEIVIYMLSVSGVLQKIQLHKMYG